MTADVTDVASQPLNLTLKQTITLLLNSKLTTVFVCVTGDSASEMTCIVSSGALNSTHSLTVTGDSTTS